MLEILYPSALEAERSRNESKKARWLERAFHSPGGRFTDCFEMLSLLDGLLTDRIGGDCNVHYRMLTRAAAAGRPASRRIPQGHGLIMEGSLRHKNWLPASISSCDPEPSVARFESAR